MPIWRRRRMPDDLTPEDREARIAELRVRRRKRLRTLAIRSALGTMALVVLLAFALYWLLTTFGGRDFLLAQVVARLPAGTQLTWQRAEGPATGPLTMHGVRYVQRGCPDKDGEPVPYGQCAKPTTLTFTAKRVTIDPDVRPLLGKLLRLDALDIDGATLDLPVSDAPFELPSWPGVLPRIELPLSLQADVIRINGFRVSQETVPLVDIRSLRGGLDARDGKLHVEHIVVDSDRGRFTAHGDYAPRDDFRTDLTVSAAIPVAAASPLARETLRLALVARGNLDRMDVALAGAAPGPVHATLTLRGRDQPTWRLRADANRLDTALLAGAEPTETPASLHVEADGVGGAASLQGRFDQGDFHAAVLPSKLALEDKVLSFQPLVLEIFGGRVTARGRGDFGEGRQATFRYALTARGLRFGGGAATTPGEPAAPAAPAIGVDADLGLSGTAAAWAVVGDARLARGDDKATVRVDGRGNADAMTFKTLQARMPSGTLDGHGDIGWSPALHWNLDATLAGFDPGYFAPGWNGQIDGTLATRGKARDSGGYDATLVIPKLGGRLRGRALDGRANLRAHGEDYDGDVALALDRSKLALKGKAGTAPRLHWDVAADLDAFDPGFFVEGWDGAVDADIASRGRARASGGYDGNVDLSRVGGRLRGRALQGHGRVSAVALASPDTQTSFEGDIALGVGASRIDAKGTLAKTLAVDAKLSPLQLADLLPDASGSLRGTLQLTGTRDAPNIAADLVGSGLKYGAYTAASLTAKGKLPWKSANGSLALAAQGVNAGVALDSLRVDAKGSVEKLQLDASARGEIGALDLSGNAERRGRNWQGTLASLQLAPAKGATWRLQSPARFTQAGAHWTLSSSCFSSVAGGSLCASADWPRRGLSLDGQALPLALATPYLPEREDGRPVVLRGEIDLDAQVKPAGNAYQGNVKLASASGGLRMSQRARNDVISYDNLALDATFDARRIKATLGSAFNGKGRIDARVDTGWEPGSPLAGEIAIDTEELTWMELFSPDIVDPTGKLAGRITLGGTRAQPALGGRAQLSNFATELPSLGIVLQQGNVVLDALADGTARIDGSIRSGEGTLDIDGSLGWRGDDTPLELHLSGNNVLVSDTRDLRAVANPDLTIRYTAAQPLAVTGTVTVPSALIDLERLDEGVSASPDVVVLDPVDPEETASSPLDLDLTLVMGDDVKLKGFGLDGTLGGQLRVRARPGRDMTAVGALEVGGRYTAYGQKLQITRGALSWSNTPVADPVLDIRAERRIESEDITAGIDVTGRATQPQASVWTDPATDDSEALSYLALGRSTSNLSSDESSQLNAASAALSAGGSVLASQVGRKLGLEDAGITDSRALGGSVLGFGKQLSPRLYIGFGVSLLGTGQVLTLKYLLKKGFDIEVESSSVENRGSINWRKEK